MDYRCSVALSSLDQQKILDLAESMNKRNRREYQRIEKKLALRVAAARKELERVVGLFVDIDPELKRVVLFGSLARDEATRLDFDIDVAVESSRYMDLLGIVLESDFKIDLIDLESASPYIRRSVERDGKELFRAE